MKFLLGRGGLPRFKTAALSDQLVRRIGRPVRIDSREFLMLDLEPAAWAERSEALLQVLDAEPMPSGMPDATHLFVVPRRGVVSPWASKAGDILTRCHVDGVRRVERGTWLQIEGIEPDELDEETRQLFYDRMTEAAVDDLSALADWFEPLAPEPLGRLALGDDPAAALARANDEMGLALNADEIDYLVEAYAALGRDPTDAELMMFAQANSEHCRHKIFNADWVVDGEPLGDSLFGMIRTTHRETPDGVLVAYDDNAAVLRGFDGELFSPGIDDPVWRVEALPLHIQIKVETHNHPTAISPEPGAATGSGGEIRDEAATGRGGRPVAGLTGFSVSDLRIPDALRPWETAPPPPSRLATALEIMIEAPIGAARYNNEFGRPNLGGYFRTFSAEIDGRLWGYHKPIMIAGGSGTIAEGQTGKKPLDEGYRVIVLGGPAMLIGLGGGAASSVHSGQSSEALDFASVQRANPEMERRCQEVIDRCWSLGADNPIASIHDVGAGGLSNAIPELLDDGGVGAELQLRAIPAADRSLSPMAIWCNESQERYVLAVAEDDLDRFRAICERERCPFADLGPATAGHRLHVADAEHGDAPVDLDLDVLLGKTPALTMDVSRAAVPVDDRGTEGLEPDAALDAVLAVPAVASKQFLITIGDRTVGGLSARDQMIGPWQVPVADCALTLTDYAHYTGTAMAMGERSPLAVWDAPASGRMAVAEALTNLAGVALSGRRSIKLSANWMAASGAPGQDAALRETVEAVALAFCRSLELAIPVGKDSLSMQTRWRDADGDQVMIAPVSLIVSAFAPVDDVRRAVTPELQLDAGPSELLLLALPGMRLGGSALAQATGRALGAVPDVDSVDDFAALFDAVQQLLAEGRILALHDRSDGGLLVSVLEMALAGHAGVALDLSDDVDPIAALFNEEIGLVVQARAADRTAIEQRLADAGLAHALTVLGRVTGDDRLRVARAGATCIDRPLAELHRAWASTSWRVQRLRDHPDCADEEFGQLADWSRPGLAPVVTFDAAPPPVVGTARPRVAILREQGVNGQREMARAFHVAGFEAVDVHMSDLEHGRQVLDGFHGLAVCGGFSFGDVLGAGNGWARSIRFSRRLGDQFRSFFDRPDTFTLGVCNGCQMLSALASMIPGAAHWPQFVHNRSRQFEARLSLVEIVESPSILLAGMAGSRLPVATAHGEGRAVFADDRARSSARVAVRYVDGYGRPAERYPDNPNGSPAGITGLTSDDGRATILMPHPERLLRAVNYSWAPTEWGEWSPWMRMFENARRWVD
ncbi:phosphoribosylformylglycinamidine synthase [Wenzhouxiangella sp. XN79A]|uniref:phosphoribosylformylglycinamidine synthase n=1 Tax=Wenzhouxiangella sp. XN79A TaxID=2724193 RepID=UPI00144A83FC|nr:phosphoribosylformylglycinamidine synthase [Wenzhouxiangella sp. XN79A]NKI35067.1 phosphoribosylformylglycinamidine synthase [Wenzhouxiangella sp. XN79A]